MKQGSPGLGVRSCGQLVSRPGALLALINCAKVLMSHQDLTTVHVVLALQGAFPRRSSKAARPPTPVPAE